LGKAILLKFLTAVYPCGAGPGKFDNSNNDQLVDLGSKMEDEGSISTSKAISK